MVRHIDSGQRSTKRAVRQFLAILPCGGLADFWFQWAPLSYRLQTQRRWFWLRWLHLQTGITLLLMPLQLHIFHGFSITSLPANLWAVPLVTFVTTPLILLALSTMTFSPLSEMLWQLADISLQVVFAPLTYLQTGWVYLDASLLIVSVAGWGAVVIWRFSWWRHYPMSVGALILILLVFRIKNDEPEWRVDMLDVGHGLAVVIEQRGKAVLYDTGNRWEGEIWQREKFYPTCDGVALMWKKSF